MQEVIIRDSKGSCPVCSGMIVTVVPYVVYRCLDCRTTFEAVEKGYAENGVLIKEKETQDGL